MNGRTIRCKRCGSPLVERVGEHPEIYCPRCDLVPQPAMTLGELRDKGKQGSWPDDSLQRAFVDGARWWHFTHAGSTMWSSERKTAEQEAIIQYGPVESGPDMKAREKLWANHGCSVVMLYGDDGELQCSHCALDFKRSSWAFLVTKLLERRSFRDNRPPIPMMTDQAETELTYEHDSTLTGKPAPERGIAPPYPVRSSFEHTCTSGLPDSDKFPCRACASGTGTPAGEKSFTVTVPGLGTSKPQPMSPKLEQDIAESEREILHVSKTYLRSLEERANQVDAARSEVAAIRKSIARFLEKLGGSK